MIPLGGFPCSPACTVRSDLTFSTPYASPSHFRGFPLAARKQSAQLRSAGAPLTVSCILALLLPPPTPLVPPHSRVTQQRQEPMLECRRHPSMQSHRDASGHTSPVPNLAAQNRRTLCTSSTEESHFPL